MNPIASFFEKLLSLFKTREKPEVSGQKELSLEEVDSFLEKSLEESKKNLFEFSARKFSEIKHLLGKTKGLLESLKEEEVETDNARLEKIVETTKRHSLHQLSALAERLYPPKSTDLSVMKKYSLESEAFLNNEIPSFGKNIAYTSIVLKENMKQIGEALQELQKIFSEINREFASNGTVFLEASALEEKKNILETRQRIIQKTMALENSEKDIAALKKRLSLIEEETEKLKGSEDAKRLLGLEGKRKSLVEKKDSLGKEIFEKTASLEKPLRKLQWLAEEKKVSFSKQQLQFLSDLLKSPQMAFKADPKGDFFKSILLELERQFEAGTIELKEKETEKKQALVKELLAFNFFEMFWEANNLTVEINNIDKEIDSIGIGNSLSEKEKTSREITALLEQKKNSLENERKSIEREAEAEKNFLAGLESTVSKITKSTEIKIRR